MGFCQWPEMGAKVGAQVGFGLQKWVKMGQNPTFLPLRDIDKNPFLNPL